MKTLYRLLVTTAVAAGCLYVLNKAAVYYETESLLGPTVDRVAKVCFAALGVVTVLIWFGCSVGFFADAVRWAVRRSKAKKRAAEAAKSGVVLAIGTQEPPHLYDAQQDPAPRRKKRD